MNRSRWKTYNIQFVEEVNEIAVSRFRISSRIRCLIPLNRFCEAMQCDTTVNVAKLAQLAELQTKARFHHHHHHHSYLLKLYHNTQETVQ